MSKKIKDEYAQKFIASIKKWQGDDLALSEVIDKIYNDGFQDGIDYTEDRKRH